MELDHLTFDQLIELKDRIDKLIQSRIVEERANLLKKLEVLHRYESKMRRARIGQAGGKSGEKENVSDGKDKKKRRFSKLAPKYRDPVTGSTWAGRGRQPRWLLEAIQDGKMPDDFLISTVQAGKH